MYVEGADELNRKLRKIGDHAGGLALRKAAEAGAKVIVAEATRLAPRETGKGAESIHAEPRALKQGRAMFDVAPSPKHWYLRFIEFGTKHIAPRSFMRRAFDTKRDEAEKAMRDSLRKTLEDVR